MEGFPGNNSLKKKLLRKGYTKEGKDVPKKRTVNHKDFKWI